MHAAKMIADRPIDEEPFMNERQQDYFRQRLLVWKEDILKELKETLQLLRDGNQNHPDSTDRASSETDRAVELRARDRQSKLIAKIVRRAHSHRQRHLRLLRGHRRADLAQCAWKRGRSRRCQLKPRSATSDASRCSAMVGGSGTTPATFDGREH
jgi:RNA polymerase-binding protein DksA